MITVLSESNPTARKEHSCMACDFILGYGVNGYVYTFAELRVIAKAKKNHFKIIKGQQYLKQINKYEGELYTFKAIPEMHQICIDHDHYEQ